MKQYKIAIVVGVFPSVSETFIINQIAFLKQSGHKVQILCTRHIVKNTVSNAVVKTHDLMNDTLEFAWRKLMPVKLLSRVFMVLQVLIKSVVTSGFWPLLKSLNVFKYNSGVFNFHQFFKVYYQHYFAIHNFDVVHIHFADNAVYLIEHLKRFNNKIVISFHGYDAHKFTASFYKPLLKLNNINYTVNTNYIKQKILRLGFPNSKISILPVGLDTSFFKPNLKKKPLKTFNILFIGRLIELKAPLLAIQIVEQLLRKHKSIHLDIIGQGEQFSTCETYIKKHNLGKHIQLLGDKSQLEIKTILDNTDIFLFPGIIDAIGRCENQGLVIQEAQAMELPVMVSDVGGMKEGLIDNETGFVIPEKDIDGFVEKLEFLMHHPKIRHDMGKAARDFVINRYDTNILGIQLLNLYMA